jgi:BirA family transcriptional regulator, biotin operon repressor / biotin---[acetyl-CoA-carboxylase] ligase
VAGHALPSLALPQAVAEAGFALRHVPETTSTMDLARAHVVGGACEPCWFVADSQTAGRGRHGRVWVSPAGNLHATLALSGPCAGADAPELGFVAGLALHRAVHAVSSHQHPALAIKWPNDLLLDGAKVAGLLLEGLQVGDRFCVLIGFGVNIAAAPADTPYRAVCLAPDAEPPGMRNALFAALSAQWLLAEALWQSGFSHVRDSWLGLAHGIGTEVRVKPPSGELRGRMLGIDARGRLLLATPGGEVLIDAGDLFFGD